jgi:hypothetical protein
VSGQQGPAVERVLAALRRHGSSGGPVMYQCPAADHDDQTASLSVGQGDVGAVLCCQRGCDTRTAILPAIGLTFADLFDRPHGSRKAFPWRVAAEYPYTDAAGTVLYVKERREPKDFRTRRPDPAARSGWAWKLDKDTPRVLYRLPEVLAAVHAGRVVYLVEGEKDADRLAALGHAATCNFDGAGKPGGRPKWRPEYGDTLTGADVVIIADRDEAGIEHARAAADDLRSKAKSVAIMQAAVTDEHADVSDHLDAGHGLDELIALPAEPEPGAAAGDGDGRKSQASMPGAEDTGVQREPVILPGIPRYPTSSLAGPLREFVEWAERDGLHPETAGAAGLAALVTLTGPARLKLSEVKEVRAILWIALIGIASSGKSPAFEHAFARIREAYADRYDGYETNLKAWDARKDTEGETAGPRPEKPQPLEYDDATVEAVARWLLARKDRDSDPSGAVIDDELASTLEGLNQYKGGLGSDRSKWLKLWTGADLSIQRVGRGGAQNEVHIYVRSPAVSLAGPLTDSNVHLMGKQGSGFRPRFLPHLAPAEQPAWNDAGPHPAAWTGCIDALLGNRKPRVWVLRGPALAEWSRARERWRRQQDEADPDDVIEALRKADAQCYRIALVIAESLAPGAGGDVTVGAVRSAVAIVDYVMDCWRALPGADTMASSRAEDVMDAMSARLLAWLQGRPKGNEELLAGSSPRPRATRREVQRWSHLKAAKVSALIMEHEARYPGCVVSAGAREGEGKGSAGGLPTVYVYAPERAASAVTVTPKERLNPGIPGEETAVQALDRSVSQLATSNSRDTAPATPNAADSAPASGTWPHGSVGDAVNPGGTS